MTEEGTVVETLEARVERRNERRDFFRNAGLAVAALGAGAGLLASARPAGAQTAPTDADVFNFLLNLEYLEAQYYAFAVNGAGLPAAQLTGTGTQGAATGGRKVTFADPLVAQYAREIAADEAAHVEFLRLALGASAVAQPAIDIGTAAGGAFSTLARSAGLIGAGQSFDPYASDENFLLGAFILEDVSVTAYRGATALVANKALLESIGGILSVEAHHAAMVRATLAAKGVATPALVDATEDLSGARDALDGASDSDQGVRPVGAASNVAPLDANGLAFTRTPAQVLNIAYLDRTAVAQGGFFPAGVNGTIKTSAAN